ncbi:MAG: FAD/NAD(P)-binding oxidoreductase [Tenuifilum sp.]|uniref:type III sulfide quinone reductase, selenoprotein subtype n=1 Tax=Tenuifilum sp. TaxID=2760880 RepID=UPI001B7B43F5|nr:NAD(P)/FAD-dependent oxidoreductase [Bacteroidales bacterium]HOK60239.1 FAD/NAD(P)-binding oxidoreductase [Tenuifilum sp.]MBP9028886.1 NAD(P)/FAD-dependent oxidoreductase [Bacteroidales bacterium]HOK86474.1 FAD/NAD(P)-binding oxidoreductase [Tenuifilum sp.]HON70699.1 FAD/NAD(P)-binding oxidoreductase [Tenuifilum sp.]
MKKIVILGAGTGGTIMANKLRKVLERDEWSITVVDKDPNHYYQPGFLFIPFGIYSKHDVVKPKASFIPAGVKFIVNDIDRVEPDKNTVYLTNGQILEYDFLIVATGTHINPAETPGLLGREWRKSIFDFYTHEGAVALSTFLKTWEGGDMVINIAELPFKCPVAPLEFAFLADEFFVKKGIRDKVNIYYTTPLSGAFTKPKSSKMLGELLKEKNIQIIPDFYLERVDDENKKIISYDGREVKFDLLTIIPVNMGADWVARSGMGDDMNYIATDKYTLRSEKWENIFVLGDASNIPTSKAGSVVHFASDVLFENLMAAIEGRPLIAKFDGHSNCYIETGFGKGSLIDFNYETEPLPGTYPLPGIGPFGLLKNTRINHYGKVMFRWIYWHLLLKGKELPLESQMTMAGKEL